MPCPPSSAPPSGSCEPHVHVSLSTTCRCSEYLWSRVPSLPLFSRGCSFAQGFLRWLVVFLYRSWTYISGYCRATERILRSSPMLPCLCNAKQWSATQAGPPSTQNYMFSLLPDAAFLVAVVFGSYLLAQPRHVALCLPRPAYIRHAQRRRQDVGRKEHLHILPIVLL
jgi:hypothetical protein